MTGIRNTEIEIHVEKNVPYTHVPLASVRRISQSFYPYSTHTHLPVAVLAQSLGRFKSNVNAAGVGCQGLVSCWLEICDGCSEAFQDWTWTWNPTTKMHSISRQRVEKYVGSVYVKNLKEIYRYLNKTWIVSQKSLQEDSAHINLCCKQSAVNSMFVCTPNSARNPPNILQDSTTLSAETAWRSAHNMLQNTWTV